jgi:hypothetical protein
MQGVYMLGYDTTHDRLFVADRNNRRVLVYSGALLSNGMNAVHVIGQANFTASSSATTQAGVALPTSAAYDTTTQSLFVTDLTINSRLLCP